MTIISIKAGTGGDLRRIELSDGSFFSFKTCYLPPIFIDETLYSPGMAEGREISRPEEDGFRFASACMRAEKAALQLIARAEQNSMGLSRKLKKRGHDSACARAVIAQLCETGLLDDRRYARLWLEARISRQASSPRRLLAAIRSRGIDQDDAEAVLKNVLDDETERQLLERYVEKYRRRMRGPDINDAEARRSLKYLLKSEGFSYSMIHLFFEE
jgi:regulatory protein